MAATDTLATLPRLKGAQAAASDPQAHVWLSASAGTGKTQVLAARVFRLLLRGVDPSAILCLTFTKAGAAEMAQRINTRLAAWVRMAPTQLAADLDALGERATPDLQERARTLFARVLDAPGGGLRIQTIHGFCQSLLAAFPVEAALTPGFRPLEAREEAVLARETLAALLADAERDGRLAPIDTIGALSLRMGEGGAESFLLACARSLPALEALPSGIGPWLRRTLDLPQGDIGEALASGCDLIDPHVIERLAAANRAWATATGLGHAARFDAWLAASPEDRALTLEDLAGTVLTGKGEPRKASKKLVDADPDYEELAAYLGAHCLDLLSLTSRAAYADLLAAGLEVGRDYARAYAAAKRRIGAVDFDDLIAVTVRLLEQPGIGDWVRYKLDQGTEHVLIDEAQDTNLNQWRIVTALASEFFVGRGVFAPATRTLFTVGDYKQAIFGFQGTDPINFRWAEGHFAQRAAAVAGDLDWPEPERGLPFNQLSLTHSFRSTRPVLEFVDAAIAAIGDPGLGIAGDLERHASEVVGPGRVDLWPPVAAGGSEEDEEAWIDDAVREQAVRIARAVRDWLRGGLMLESKGRALRPEDVMILVKRRGDLASLIVARLYAEGVPVAGVDRLRLNAPLAVQDLLAAVRFVLQPEDDLSLASLLVSPLIGWTQEELMTAAPRDAGSLWSRLTDTQADDRVAPLRDMLGRADIDTPYQFLEALLSGPLDGRRKLIRRLGEEARDPIEELLNAALLFETTSTPSLQRFLDWFDRGDVEIVRDPSAPLDAVRVMTAHGAKGLQAPLVILADATVDPTAAPRALVRWTPEAGAQPLPIFRPRSAERGGPLDAAIAEIERRELEEHWRLFYVAATRAEERLVIGGALGPRAKGVPPAASWYAAASRAFDALGIAGEGARSFIGTEPQPPVKPRPRAKAFAEEPATVPDWARRPAPQESRPSRPLAPSALGEDEVSDPPPGPAMRAAAERGRLYHALFERLPAVAPPDRVRAADQWLASAGGLDDPRARADIVDCVLSILDDARFIDLFGPAALAEAPIAATLDDGTVVSGTVDRLLVTADAVRVVDFKTGRRPPASADDIPPYHLAQIGAYAAALAVVFPGRRVEAGLLYTAGPRLFDLTPAILAAHKPGLRRPQQS
ncbi:MULTISPECIES: double-strand break repair helicase AddA [unclassified Sphingomonas]|jgi:ATP-dependent helicase/nuclease subunit A|uniref:double-strand break repair helicase AddA n=1 Tax=unclassified Sphingomonas TaxID=196159 RepID=UPI000E1021AA|nr:MULTISPECIES: double-strand break repair helicase AddA [unclassified Sphingomonas]AXJ96173.1 double-strand break repair helicase AddA [Sphingomonas sp. FARSPH]